MSGNPQRRRCLMLGGPYDGFHMVSDSCPAFEVYETRKDANGVRITSEYYRVTPHVFVHESEYSHHASPRLIPA